MTNYDRAADLGPAWDSLCTFFFVSFAVVFFLTRLVFLPLTVIPSGYWEAVGYRIACVRCCCALHHRALLLPRYSVLLLRPAVRCIHCAVCTHCRRCKSNPACRLASQR